MIRTILRNAAEPGALRLVSDRGTKLPDPGRAGQSSGRRVGASAEPGFDSTSDTGTAKESTANGSTSNESTANERTSSEPIAFVPPRRGLLADERGAVTAEYAIVIMAAVAFALLVAIMRSSEIRAMLVQLVENALGAAG